MGTSNTWAALDLKAHRYPSIKPLILKTLGSKYGGGRGTYSTTVNTLAQRAFIPSEVFAETGMTSSTS